MKWRDLWPYAHSVAGWITAAFTAILAIYYGPKKMLETWDWYMDRLFDSKVRGFLESHAGHSYNTVQGPRRWGKPQTLEAISAGVGMSKKRALNSLKRLSKKKQVSQHGEDWKIVDT